MEVKKINKKEYDDAKEVLQTFSKNDLVNQILIDLF